MKEKDIKQMFKKSPEELAMYMHFKKRGFVKKNRKGKRFIYKEKKT